MEAPLAFEMVLDTAGSVGVDYFVVELECVVKVVVILEVLRVYYKSNPSRNDNHMKL
jgi:hypothetical protein